MLNIILEGSTISEINIVVMKMYSNQFQNYVAALRPLKALTSIVRITNKMF